jgi:hypothetical protein
MPSLHFGWALWCAIIFWTCTRHKITRMMVVIYPLMTLAAIVVTANHYWLDAVGGAVILVAAVLILAALDRHVLRRPGRSPRPSRSATAPQLAARSNDTTSAASSAGSGPPP